MVSSPGKPTLVIISSIHWHFTWQRHHDIASGFAKLGYRVIFIEPIPKRWPTIKEILRVFRRVLKIGKGGGTFYQEVPENVTILSPLMVPDTSAFGDWLNQIIFIPRFIQSHQAAFSGSDTVYLINYLPIPSSLHLQQALGPDVSAYDCVWDWSNDPKAPKMRLIEDLLIRNVSMVFADSPFLLNKMRAKHETTHRVLPAVHYDLFADARHPGKPSNENQSEAIVGYFGNIGVNIDVDLLEKVSEMYPLRVIGPYPEEKSQFSPNTTFVGPVPHRELPALLAEVDVLLLPYNRSAHLPAVIPAKTFECLATGKPIVAIGLESLREFEDYFYFSETDEEFLQNIALALHEPLKNTNERLSLAKHNDWQSRIRKIESYFKALAINQQDFSQGN